LIEILIDYFLSHMQVGGITSFAVVRESCLGCKAALKPSGKLN
jgi:hypothetical protein